MGFTFVADEKGRSRVMLENELIISFLHKLLQKVLRMS